MESTAGRKYIDVSNSANAQVTSDHGDLDLYKYSYPIKYSSRPILIREEVTK